MNTRGIVSAVLLLSVAGLVGAPSAGVPTFVARRDLRPVRHVPTEELAILQTRVAPLAAWRLTAGQLDPNEAARYLRMSAQLSVDERKAVKALMSELSDNKDLKANTLALRDALSAAIFLDSPKWREKTAETRDLLGARDRLDDFFRRMPSSELDAMITPWYGVVPSFEIQSLDTGDVSNLFVLQVWDACTMRNEIADEMPLVGRDLDEYWTDAKRLGLIEQTPDDLRTAAEEDSVLRRQADDEWRQHREQEALRLAPKTTAVAALDALFTRDHGYGWHGATNHGDDVAESADISPGMQALLEYASGSGQGAYVAAETLHRIPSVQFGALSKEAGGCLASWFRYSMEQSIKSALAGYAMSWAQMRAAAPHNKKLAKQIAADSTSTAQKLIEIFSPGLRMLLLEHYPSDSTFIKETFPADPEAVPPYQLVGDR